MKVLALQGSPRTDGNTQAVLDFVLDAAREAGADAEVVQLGELDDFTGCRECSACQTNTDEPACAIDDDMQPLFEKLLKADVVVFATPVFCWSPSWLLKIAMDRFYCMFKFQGDEIRTLLEGKRMAAVITAGGDDKDGADLVTETCRRMAEFSKNRWLGAFVASNVKDPASIRSDDGLTARATAFGRQLVA